MPLWIGLIFALRLFPTVVGEVENNQDGSLREVMEYFMLACTVCSLLDFYVEIFAKFFANQGTMRTNGICDVNWPVSTPGVPMLHLCDVS